MSFITVVTHLGSLHFCEFFAFFFSVCLFLFFCTLQPTSCLALKSVLGFLFWLLACFLVLSSLQRGVFEGNLGCAKHLFDDAGDQEDHIFGKNTCLRKAECIFLTQNKTSLLVLNTFLYVFCSSSYFSLYLERASFLF